VSTPTSALDRATQHNTDTYERLWPYAHFRPPSTLPWWPLIQELAANAPTRLEIGPGPWPRLPVAGTHVVDLSAHARAMLAAQGAIAHAGQLAELAFPAGHFDLAGAFEVLEHVEDDRGLLGELARVIKSGGRFIMSVPIGMRFYTPFDRYVGHVRRYEPDELRAKLEQAGFAIDRFEARDDTAGTVGGILVVWMMRWFPRLSMWVTERLLLPLMDRTKLDFRDASEWETRMKTAAQCTVVCTRK
jgi:SAM-dependent methyltransferase